MLLSEAVKQLFCIVLWFGCSHLKEYNYAFENIEFIYNCSSPTMEAMTVNVENNVMFFSPVF